MDVAIQDEDGPHCHTCIPACSLAYKHTYTRMSAHLLVNLLASPPARPSARPPAHMLGKASRNMTPTAHRHPVLPLPLLPSDPGNKVKCTRWHHATRGNVGSRHQHQRWHVSNYFLTQLHWPAAVMHLLFRHIGKFAYVHGGLPRGGSKHSAFAGAWLVPPSGYARLLAGPGSLSRCF